MIGKDVPVSAICEIRDRLAGMLFRRGVFARVEIPAQNITLAEGSVSLEVIEARIVSVRYHTQGDIGPVQSKVEAYLDRLRGMAPFNLDTAQHYLLLANDLPGVQVVATPRPSTVPAATPEDARGALDLDVQITRRALDEVAAVQNSSSSALGPWSGIARVDFNSFTSFGERTSLIGYSTLGNNEQEVVQLLEEARIGGQGLTARASFAYGRSRPGDVLAPLNLRGESYVGNAELYYPLVRLRRENLTLHAGMDFINQTTDFPGGGALSEDSLRVLWGRADGSAQHQFLDPTFLGYVTTMADLSIEGRKGIDALGSSQPGAVALSRIEGRADAFVVRGEGQGSVRFDPAGRGAAWVLSARFQGQWANKPLLAYEEQPIGNLSIGRGYDPDAVSGDRVIASEFRSQIGPIAIGRHLSVSPYAFYDIAKVTNLDTGSQDVTVRSFGGGAELRLMPYNIRADLAYAKPLDKPFAAALTKPPARFLLQVVFVHY